MPELVKELEAIVTNGKSANAHVILKKRQTISLDETRAASVLKLLDALEELDDVQAVYSNIDVPADVLERISESA